MSCPDPKRFEADLKAVTTFPIHGRKRQENLNDVYQIYSRVQTLMETLRIKRMPTEQEFLANGERDVLFAVLSHGGLRVIATQMGVEYTSRKSRGYWSVFENVETEFRRFMAEQGLHTMPSEKHLEAADRRNLLMAAKRQGGLRAVAARMGVPANPVGRPRKKPHRQP